MKTMKYITFLSILSGIFFILYRQSDKKGFRRWWVSFKVALIISLGLSGLIAVNPESIEPPGNDNQVYQARLLSDQALGAGANPGGIKGGGGRAEFSNDELEALGFGNSENNNNKEVTLVVGIPIPYPSKPTLSVNQEHLNGLVQESNLPLHVEQKPNIFLQEMSDLKNSKWIENFISSLRGGEEGFDETLIRSILSKVSDSHFSIPSINKILKKIADVTLEIGSNSKLMKILAELEKPMRPSDLGVMPIFTGEPLKIANNFEDYQVASRRPSSTFVEGFNLPRLPRHRRKEEFEWKKKTKSSTPSADSLLDMTKCYGHREDYNMPRDVSEQFETKVVKKLAKTSLQNPRVKKEYNEVKLQLKEGIHPANISNKSTYVSSTKVLVKKPGGRFLVDVSDTEAIIVGVSARTDKKCMAKFKKLMNKLYDLNLEGY